jgi:O-antigen ligase
MREFVKEVLLNPINFCFIIINFIFFTILLLRFANNKKILIRKLENLCITIFFLSIMGWNGFPFKHLHPANLLDFKRSSVSLFIQCSIYIYIIFILFILNPQHRDFFRHTRTLFNNPSLGILLSITVLSSLWSEDPTRSLSYSIVLLGAAAFTTHISNLFSWQEIAKLWRWSCTFMALASIPVALLLPQIGINHVKNSWQGVQSHPNHLGALMALNAILWYLNAADKPQYRWRSLGWTILSLTIMILTKSAGAIAIFLVLLSLLVFLHFSQKSLNFSQLVITTVLFISVGIVMTFLITENLESLLSFFNKDITLTGRTDFWQMVIEAIGKRPLLGYGFKGFWLPEETNDPSAFIRTYLGWGIEHSHNGFLELTVDLGLVGLLLFIFSLLQNVALGVLYASHSKLFESTLPLIILTFVVIKNISEVGLWDVVYYDSFLYVFVTVRLSLDISKHLGKEPKKIKQRKFVPYTKRSY